MGNEMDTNYWNYHTEGARCFIVTAEGYTVCEVIAPGENDPVPVARKIARDHNDVVARSRRQPSQMTKRK